MALFVSGFGCSTTREEVDAQLKPLMGQQLEKVIQTLGLPDGAFDSANGTKTYHWRQIHDRMYVEIYVWVGRNGVAVNYLSVSHDYKTP
jgi:hypothetical protein